MRLKEEVAIIAAAAWLMALAFTLFACLAVSEASARDFVKDPHVAVSIDGTHQDGTHSRLSGVTIFSSETESYCLTNWHLFNDSSPVVDVRVGVPDDNWYSAKVVATEKQVDCTILRFAPGHVVPWIEIGSDPVAGRPYSLVGYPGGSQISVKKDGVAVQQQYTDGSREFTFRCVQGDSGAPIIGEDGKLAAINWGGDGRTSMGFPVSVLQNYFRRVGFTQFCIGGQCFGGNLGSQLSSGRGRPLFPGTPSSPYTQPQQPARTPYTAPAVELGDSTNTPPPLFDPPQSSESVSQQLQRLADSIDRISAACNCNGQSAPGPAGSRGPAGERGPEGPMGPAGPRGPAGASPEIDYERLAQVMLDRMSITVQTVDEGKVVQSVKAQQDANGWTIKMPLRVPLMPMDQ